MEKSLFSMREALSIGWQKSWEQAKFLLSLFGIWIAYLVVLWLIKYLCAGMEPLNWVIILISSIISHILTCGMLRIYYDIYTFGKSSYEQLYKSKKYFITSIFASLEVLVYFVGWIALSAGAIFGAIYGLRQCDLGVHPLDTWIVIGLAIPCLFILFNIVAMFLFVPITIISDDAPRAAVALKMSRALTKGHRVKLLLFGLVSSLLVTISLGFLTSTIGIAWMHVYKKLKN